MANKVFVSPGVYTREVDLTFVKQNVGVTTLGLVGETVKGPAQEPIFIRNYDEFVKIFGAQNPEKFGNGYLKFQVPYVARQYLKESNQLYVTRVLGYSGYNAGTCTWAISVSGDTNHDDMVVALLRSKRPDSFDTCYTTGVTLDVASYSATTTDAFATFGLSAHTSDGTLFYEVSLDKTKKDFIVNVLGDTPQGKDTALWVEEIFYETLVNLDGEGSISGLTSGSLTQLTNLTYYTEQFQTPQTPWILSEIRGNKIDRLFRFISISDGDSANKEIKISFVNINLEDREFDVVVRDFSDTDDNMLVLEQFKRCSMNPALANYVAKRIGTVNGEYPLRSSFIMLELNANHPIDAVPAGFTGFPLRDYTGLVAPKIMYKTNIDETTEKVRRTYYGISDTIGIDQDFFDYKGKVPTNDYYDSGTTGVAVVAGDSWSGVTDGFHMDINANGKAVEGLTETVTFQVGEAAFVEVTDLVGTAYEKSIARKFTVAPYGGFDGWDVYRETRTNTDSYLRGTTTFTNEGFSNTSLPNVEFGGTSDYYAYLNAILTFQNPESVNINLFATPGINYVDQKDLVTEALDMIENDRADTLYIIDAPDVTGENISYNDDVEDAVDNLVDSEIDSSYAATYFPWIQVKDSENGVYLWMPPTLEVVRNAARTDNLAFPWFAIAGYNRGVTNAVQARFDLTQDHRDELYKGRLNPITTFSEVGVLIFGNKTLQVRESPLDRISVRRLLLQARKLISAVSVRLLFEPNDNTVREQFLDLVNPILENIRRDRGLIDFRVTLSNDPEEIDRLELSGKIYIKPARTVEFISLDFVITPTGASFDDV